MKRLLLALALYAGSVSAEPPQVPVAVARLSDGELVVILQSQQGHCPDGLKQMYVVAPQAYMIWAGCYMTQAGQVHGVDEDGDRFSVPVDVFQWAKGKKPVSL